MCEEDKLNKIIELLKLLLTLDDKEITNTTIQSIIEMLEEERI